MSSIRKKRKKIQKKVVRIPIGSIAELEKRLRNTLQRPVANQAPVVAEDVPGTARPQIFRSEMDYISRCILDRPNIETGGQLFGYWAPDGTPIVVYAIGPGPRANHQSTFFNQDVDYLLKVGNELRNRYDLQHIGEWHSHHRLGLARPSSHDTSTMVTTIREKGLGRFLLCIGNCDDRGASLNPFLCDERVCTPSVWNIIERNSPVRKTADSDLSPLLLHPTTRYASYSDPSFRPVLQSSKPEYASSYWLNEKRNSAELKRILDYVRRENPLSETAVRLDSRNLVHVMTTEIARNNKRVTADIVFPMGFPDRAPEYTLIIGHEKEIKAGEWNFYGDIFSSFVKYYTSIVNR